MAKRDASSRALPSAWIVPAPPGWTCQPRQPAARISPQHSSEVRIMESIEELLLKNGFPKPHHIEQRASIASLFTKEKRCGIYVLHFANGEYYVGQSIDVVRRHSDHRRKHTDIRQIIFNPVPPNSLDAEEK